MKWNDYFLAIAETVATKSKDASTKVGAVLVRPDNSIASTGFNGFSPRVPDNPAFLSGATEELRFGKLCRIIHAEINAIRFCRDHDTNYYRLYLTHHPCDECAKFITTTGIVAIHYFEKPDFETRWRDKLLISKEVLAEAGIGLYSYG